MLAVGQQHECLPYVIAIVSAMSVGDPFLYEEAIGVEDENETGSEEEGMPHLNNEAVRVKEMKRLRRKAFFQSHHVSFRHNATYVAHFMGV
jgi:ATP-dependent RNA helicase DHX37/DHR1